MLEKLLSKTGLAIWMVLSCIAMCWLGFEGLIRNRGPLGWLAANGYLNKLTVLLAFGMAVVACWPCAFLYDFITRQGIFKKQKSAERGADDSDENEKS